MDSHFDRHRSHFCRPRGGTVQTRATERSPSSPSAGTRRPTPYRAANGTYMSLASQARCLGARRQGARGASSVCWSRRSHTRWMSWKSRKLRRRPKRRVDQLGGGQCRVPTSRPPGEVCRSAAPTLANGGPVCEERGCISLAMRVEASAFLSGLVVAERETVSGVEGRSTDKRSAR